MERDDRLALDAAALAGEILLESGAEIFRVEDTIYRIAAAYGAEEAEAFVLSSGIFLTSEGEGRKTFARVKHIPLVGARLDRVSAVNQLSREIEQGLHTPEAAMERLEAIRTMPRLPAWLQVLASGVGSGCFCILFGGDWADALAAAAAGLLLYFYLLFVVKGRLSKIATNITGGALVTLAAVLLHRVGLGHHLDMMIIGSIIPLVPGVAFTNGIRDIADEDYIAGSVRLLDVLLVTFCIAFGVGAVMAVRHALTGL